MLTEQRFYIILKLLEERKSITVTELRELLDASESTVRRDITALDKAGKLTKVFGGAVALNHKVTAYEPTVAQKSELNKEEKKKIAKQDEVMQVFTSILRQELMEEVVELNAATGQFVKTKKPPSISEVIKAGSELMKRYPTEKQAEKMQLEIDKLKAQVGGDEGQDEKIAGFLNLIKGAVSDGLE